MTQVKVWNARWLYHLPMHSRPGSFSLNLLFCLGVLLSLGSSIARGSNTPVAPVSPSAPKAIDPALTAKAEGGDVASMMELGRAYFTGNGATVDLDKAHLWLQRAADKGSFEAQMALGTAHK